MMNSERKEEGLDQLVPAQNNRDDIEDEMDLVNAPNPWLPAYGFQLQNHYQSVNGNDDDDIDNQRSNESTLVQQVDFLETILEETEDDLQSDSDRSGTTYWLGSDSETESVIHIKSSQKPTETDNRQEESQSGSECNSVVPKKRRRRNANECESSLIGLAGWASPRSSRSSSSRSSSLIQFETLERTCATISPSGYSYDSLEFSNSQVENTSPDSLEADDDDDDDDGKQVKDILGSNTITKIRPYRSFESLDTCHHQTPLANNNFSRDFSSLFSQKTSHDLSGRRRDANKSEEIWEDNYEEEYDEYEDDSEDLDEDENVPHFLNNYNKNYNCDFDEPRVLQVTFGDSLSNSVFPTALDFRNTIDLREIGIEKKNDTILDLARSQIGSSSLGLHQSTLNLATAGTDMTSHQPSNYQRHHHHHHHHHHHNNNNNNNISNNNNNNRHHHHHHYHHQQQQHQDKQEWTNSTSSDFNFSYTEKSQSLPSLASAIDDSTCFSNTKIQSCLTTVSSSSLFDNYTRIASVPVDLNLCKSYLNINSHQDDKIKSLSVLNNNLKKMADESVTICAGVDEQVNSKMATDEEKKYYPKRTSSVRTQKRLNEIDTIVLNDIDSIGNSNYSLRSSSSPSFNATSNNNGEVEEELGSNEDNSPLSSVDFDQPKLTVKTQDLGNNVIEMAIAMENDIDEAIKQFKRQVDDGAEGAAALAAMETIRRMRPQQQQRKVKNNASYELAQQWEIDVGNLQKEQQAEGNNSKTRRVHNNASYELAQQSDYIRVLEGRQQFQRMDACDELAEAQEIPEKKEQGFLEQIKKNSDIFSACGNDGDNNGNICQDDEVDFPCLETKPIGNDYIFKTETSSYIHCKKNSNLIEKEEGKEENEKERRMSFLGDFYPEVSDAVCQQQQQQQQQQQMEVNNIVMEGEKEKKEGPVEANIVVVEEEEEEGKKYQQKNNSQQPENNGTSCASINLRDNVVKSLNDNTTVADKFVNIVEEAKMSAIAAKRLAESSSPSSSFILTQKNSNNYHQPPSSSLSSSPIMERKERKGGLGGFLQRFSKLRFSGRSKVPRSEVKRNDNKFINDEEKNKLRCNTEYFDKRKNEPDFIIIPLHAPENEEENKRQQQQQEVFLRRPVNLERSSSCLGRNGRPPVCTSKPPLPPQNSLRACAQQQNQRSNTTTSPGVTTINSRRRATTDLGSPIGIEMAKARAMQQQQQQQQQHHHHQQNYHQVDQVWCGKSDRPVGLLETDLDADTTTTITSTSTNNITGDYSTTEKKTQSLLNLNHSSSSSSTGTSNHHHHHHTRGDNINDNVLRVPMSSGPGSRHSNDHTDSLNINQRPHKSMEFLLDKENLHFVKPPENELQKVGERVPSEHELRVQRSLQRLNVPDWYKNSPVSRDGGGFKLKRHSDASQHGGWRSLGSKTTSLSSLSSSSNRQTTAGPLLSPSPTPPPVFSRWSTSLLNSAGSSPANSARSSFNHRQPYLGWRSQERLTNPRTPAERLAQGILPAKKNQPQQTSQQLEVRNSIKEVTSAIVHYVQSGNEGSGGGGGLSPRPRPDEWDDNRAGARSTSPRGSVRLCWMESSFVGTRPVDSPETPMSLATDTECCAGCNAAGNETCSCVDSSTSGLHLNLTPTKETPRKNRRYYFDQAADSKVSPSPNFSSSHHHRHHQQQQQQHHQQHRGSGQSDEDERATTATAILHSKPSPGSTTLEDVLDSLLGLPPASRTPSPGPSVALPGHHHHHHHHHSHHQQQQHRQTTTANQSNSKSGKNCNEVHQDLQGRRTIVR